MNRYNRREAHTFVVQFWEDPDQKIPLVPLDATKYPQFSMYGPGGNVLWSGTLQQSTNGSSWEVTWNPGDDIPISDEYRIEFLMVTKDGRQVVRNESFGVQDIRMGLETRDQRILAFFGQPVVVQLAFDSPQVNVQVTALDSSDNPIEGPMNAEHFEAEGSHFYRTTLSGGAYPMDSTNVLLWTIQESALSVPTFVYQIIDTIGSNTLLQVNQIRMLVDKFNKVHGSYQEIRDIEIIESLKQGANIINSFHPFTQWGYATFRTMQPMFVFHTAASAWWLLNSQFLLEVDLQFDFTGQSVQLSYNRTQGIESELQRLWQFLQDMLPKAKLQMVRQMNGVGHLATRPMSYRHMLRGIKMPAGRFPGIGITKANESVLISLFSGGR